MKLIEHLLKVNGEQPAIYSSSGEIKYQEIIDEARKYSERLSGKRVALHCSNIIDSVTFMVAVDSFGSSLVLLQPEEELSVTANLIEESEVDFVISDSVNKLQELVTVPVFPSLSHAVETTPPFLGKAVEEDARWVVSTSGTTGKPKLVEHSLYSLTRTSKNDKSKGCKHIWGLLYGFTRFAGLQVVLQSLLSGSTLIAPNTQSSLSCKLNMLSEYNCTHLSATPTMWRKILMEPSSKNLNLTQITLGGEISDGKVLTGLKQTYPNAYVTHIYASTEAGVGFSVKDGEPGFPASYLTAPPNGIEIKIIDGRLWIKNQYVSSEYMGKGGCVSKDGWVDTGDNVELTSDRVFFLGRGNGVINVGGNKVHPETVETALLSHSLVSEARVYAKKNPIMGALVIADIVLSDKDVINKSVTEDIKKFLENKLEPFMIPAIVKVVDKLSVNSAGKLARK
ncbi:class I adenylate-forming enzyme family protein [Idiomarina abyssalis]|uniref:class I adenylate-forming enzyme family protein n=1 Tax=Idiomarina abyssalis TaxID=86102 RepID=UPI001C9678DB|nr:class I adenylate-forming enzyme family protein [Idiomarina abyssalis]QZN91404.1 acyl--CoA ligase [Idiomarina abyssalis]